MPPKSLVAAACVLLLGGGITFALIGDRDAAPPARAAPLEVVPTAATLPTPEPAGAVRTVAAEQTTCAPRPIPDDAEWIELAVVDKETQAPVPGATVQWFDETSSSYAAERAHVTRTEHWLLHDDGERLADLGGWRTSTDAKGRARVAVAGTTTVLAECDRRCGELLVRPRAATPADGHRVELEADRELRVQALDAGGAPRGGVIVWISDRYLASRVARTRDADGIATFRHLQRIDPPPIAADEATSWHAKLVVLGHEDPGASFSIAAPPAEPIVLRLPPCGSVRARAEFAGRPASTIREIDFEYVQGQKSFTEPVAVGTDGCAHLRHVALGLDLAAQAPWFGYTEFAGPREAGQQVDVTVTPVAEHTTWTGRLLTLDGTPVGDQPFCVQLSTTAGYRLRPRQARTEADGRFVVSLWQDFAGARYERIWFDWPPRVEGRSRAELAPRTLRSGIEDLGDVMPTTPALVVGGRMTVTRSLKRVTLRVERHEPSQREPERWLEVDDLLVDRRPDGAFTIRGSTEPGRHRLVVGNGVQPVEPIEFALGRADLTLDLETGHDLAAGVLLPRGVQPELIRASLVPSRAAQVGPALRERLTRVPEPQHGERHDVQWASIPAGIYTLELRPWAVAEAVLRIDDVRVPAPAGGDPRLAAIDLRTLVRATTLVVTYELDRSGLSLDVAVFPSARPIAGPWPGYDIGGAAAELVLPTGPFDVLVCCGDHLPQRVRGVAGEQVAVRMQEWPTSTFTFAGMPPLPDGVTAHVRAVPMAPVRGRYETPSERGDVAALIEPRSIWCSIDQGRAEVRLGDDNHRIEVTVRNHEAHLERRIDALEPAVVAAPSSGIVVRIPPDTWRQAIDAVTTPK